MSSSKQSSVKSLPFLAMPTRTVPSPAASPVLHQSPALADSFPSNRPHNPITLKPETPRQLLIPLFDRPLAQLSETQHDTRAKHHKLIRHHKSASRELLSTTSFPQLQEPSQSSPFAKFRVIHESKRLHGFQCHAVEKRLVERDPASHPLTTVTALTNNPTDVVNVAVIAPPLSLSPAAAEEELQHVIYQLKRISARPHETADGIIMITSFSSFRGDLNLILIPDGDCEVYRTQLFTNINLARMGCGGRSAPTLDTAPAATQEKFLALYAIPPTAVALVGFNTIVLEFIRLVQAALAIFGLFSVEASDRDGLLCDLTVKGMQRWVHSIGEPYFRLEPMEAVLEPSAVVALLSLVAAFRWRMYSLGASSIPRDPFNDPEAALLALVAFQKSHNQQPFPYLSYSLLEQINAAHTKALKSEAYKVHKVIMHRPEDCETETMNIDAFVRGIVSSGKDGIDSLRLVWTGRARKERKKDREEEKDTEGEGDDVSEHISRILRKGAGNVHALASGVVDGVKDGVKELGGLTRSRKGTDPIPTFTITQSDPEPDTDAPRISKFSRNTTIPQPATLAGGPRSGRSSLLALPSASSSTSELDRNKLFFISPAKPGSIKSFKTVLASGSVGPLEMRPALRRTHTDAREVFMERDEDELGPSACSEQPGEDVFEMAAAARNCKRRSSLSDIQLLKDGDIMPLERMHTDVELCGQFLELRDREVKMRHAITIAEVTLAAIQRTNTHLDRELIAHKQALAVLVPRAASLHNQAKTYLAEADELSKSSQMLEYQLDRLEEGVKDMSRTVAGGRKRVRALRGEARKVGGVHGIEEDSGPEDDGSGTDDKTTSILGLQSISEIQKQFGSWLSTAKPRD